MKTVDDVARSLECWITPEKGVLVKLGSLARCLIARDIPLIFNAPGQQEYANLDFESYIRFILHGFKVEVYGGKEADKVLIRVETNGGAKSFWL
jgi:hypothetical protein